MLIFLAMLAFNSPELSAAEEVKPAVEQRVLAAWEGDHAFMIDFSARPIPVIGDAKVATGLGVEFNENYPWNWLMYLRGSSSLEVTLNLTAEQAQKPWNLGVSHLSSLFHSRDESGSPIDILVNGEIVASHFLPRVDAWREDDFTVNLREGANSIVIRLLEDANSHYWIQKLYLDPIQ